MVMDRVHMILFKGIRLSYEVITKQIGNYAIRNLTFRTADPEPSSTSSTTGNSLPTLSKSCIHVSAMFLVAEGLQTYRKAPFRVGFKTPEPTLTNKHFE